MGRRCPIFPAFPWNNRIVMFFDCDVLAGRKRYEWRVSPSEVGSSIDSAFDMPNCEGVGTSVRDPAGKLRG